jgi:hyaluronoglucosaminidase
MSLEVVMVGFYNVCVIGLMVAVFSPVKVDTASFDTSFKTYKKNVPELSMDGDPSTYFWSHGKPKKDDHFTVMLDSPITAKRIRILNGKPDGSDMMEGVTVQLAGTDGTFVDYATYVNIDELVMYPNGPVKSIRILPAEQGNWVVIREIYFEN